MKSIKEILEDYTAGETELEETNAVLKEAGASFHLEPGRNALTEEDLKETVVGYYPEQASGWGLLDTGTGSVDKVHITGGRLDTPVNEVLPDGSASMAAYVTVCGRVYQVLGDALAEVRERSEDQDPPMPKMPDLRRRPDLAGKTLEQRTKTGRYAVEYDLNGYAIGAMKLREES